MTLEILNILLRGVAIGGFLATVLVLVGNGKATRVMWLCVVFYLCVIAHVVSGIDGFRTTSTDRMNFLWFAQNLATPLLWATLLGIFDDTKERFWVRLIPVAVLATLSLVSQNADNAISRAYWIFFHVVSIAMMIHLVVITLRGLGGDLVQARRQLRAPLIVAAALYITFLAWADTTNQFCCSSFSAFHVVQAGMLACLGLGTTIGFLQAGPIFWGTRLQAVDDEVPGLASPADGLEKTLLARLQRALDEDQIWKREGLSIGTLAHDLAIPEYRLRRLINERLGYRNFADFINSHRVTAAKVILSDPAQATQSISQIAYDLGFASLGPFNRVFKADTNQSPSEWREAKLAET